MSPLSNAYNSESVNLRTPRQSARTDLGRGCSGSQTPTSMNPRPHWLKTETWSQKGQDPKLPVVQPQAAEGSCSPETVGAARSHSKDALHDAAPPCAPGLPGHPPQGPLATVPCWKPSLSRPQQVRPRAQGICLPLAPTSPRTQACPRPHPTPLTSGSWEPSCPPSLSLAHLLGGDYISLMPTRAWPPPMPSCLPSPPMPPREPCTWVSTMAPTSHAQPRWPRCGRRLGCTPSQLS